MSTSQIKNTIRRPTLLVILDGYGVNPNPDFPHNGVKLARTPRFDDYFTRYPHTTLQASGRAVGLPDGQMGNSEVGHLTLGSGTVLRQDLVRIDDAIADGSFYDNPALLAALTRAREASRPLHLLGLVSDGGVHSHVSHLLALLELCRRQGVKPLLHMITDGRDTPPQSIRQWLPTVQSALAAAGGQVATVGGRYYAMDRDNRWERVELAWQSIVHNRGRQAVSVEQAIEQAYVAGEGDEFITPTVLPGATPLQPNDTMIFFNFRKDRTRQITAALCSHEFSGFERGAFKPVIMTCFTEYDRWFSLPFAFDEEVPKVTLAQILSEAGLSQFHCAETEKYPHVTYFFNGGRGEAWPGEVRTIIDSPKVATYDLQPAMSATQVADAVIGALESREYGFVVVNFANGDMVGHTAVAAAVVEAVETLDQEVGRVLDCAVAREFSVILTADHGNCEEMVDHLTGEPHTQHTVYPVPCLIIDPQVYRLREGAGLSSIAPTVLQLMGLPQPSAMTGEPLIRVDR